MIFESHAHYDDEAFDKDREELLNSFMDKGIEYVVNIGSTISDSKKTIELTKKYPFIYGSIGVHPSETKDMNEDDIKWLKEMSSLDKIIAIGEIGLDYYWDNVERAVQKHWFERQLDLAKEANLPVVVHSRDAASDTFDIIKNAKLDEKLGVLHCFAYSKEMAKQYIDMGFYIGVGGVLTFKNARKLREVVEYIPLDYILLETDSPYLAPEPNRGKRNDSTNLKYVASEIARIKNIDYEEVIEITRNNGINLFRIKDNRK
ncbi:MAG: TatD family hydrolase [Clostridiales bacterium]|nr:TatD family hydrolase [Clostridiales bacterium]